LRRESRGQPESWLVRPLTRKRPMAPNAYCEGLVQSDRAKLRLGNARRLRGLSRVKGNFHARFLGGGAAAMPPRYPALRSATRLNPAIGRFAHDPSRPVLSSRVIRGYTIVHRQNCPRRCNVRAAASAAAPCATLRGSSRRAAWGLYQTPSCSHSHAGGLVCLRQCVA
jgi:hypothetical protein